MKKLFIGIDNGVSGTVGIVGGHLAFYKTPTKKVLKYTKKKSYVTRIDLDKLFPTLQNIIKDYDPQDVLITLERPMVNPKRFVATSSALRAWEATLILVERLGVPFDYIDSKEWQKHLLPKGVKGSPELKKASRQIGERLFPSFKDVKHEDMDGLLIAEYKRQTYK